jgi:hypothetical protein
LGREHDAFHREQKRELARHAAWLADAAENARAEAALHFKVQ